MQRDSELRMIFEKFHTIAVYGMSKNPEKPAHTVPAYLGSRGFQIIPVNPSAATILNRPSYPNLQSVPESIDVVEVFRPSAEALTIVQEAVERKKERGDIAVIWLQEGIKNDDAKRLAEEHGITFVQDMCMYREHRRLFPADR